MIHFRKKVRTFLSCLETVFKMNTPGRKSFVFDFLFSMTIFQSNVESKSKKGPSMEIQKEKKIKLMNIKPHQQAIFFF